MNVSIGIRGAARELQLELAIEQEELFRQVEEATQSKGVLSLTDTKDQRVLIPGEAIAFVVVAPEHQRRVGFALG